MDNGTTAFYNVFCADREMVREARHIDFPIYVHLETRETCGSSAPVQVAHWEHDRNANHTKANWHFTTPNARVKLKHLYPSI
jgi:hypothetical protein